MSVALCEQQPSPSMSLVFEEHFSPALEVIAIPDLLSDELARKRADKLMRFAGETAIKGTDTESYVPQNVTLFDALQAAARGDEIAAQMVRTNVHTDVFERSIKAGFVLSVNLDVDENGKISQHGQSNEQIQLNTLAYLGGDSKMLPRFQAETRNMYRLENAFRAGYLEDYNFVVLSRCADDMTDSELSHAGFFAHTKSLAVQTTGLDTQGSVMTESAFVAGICRNGVARHDAAMVAAFGERIGVKLEGNATETIDTPLLIPKSLMPNGVIDIVAMLDESTGTFFGENQPIGDYAAFRNECRMRENEMTPLVKKITDELITKSATVRTPLEAVKLLDKISGEHLAEYAVKDERIDVRVFGEKAAWHLTNARAHLANGDFIRMQQASQDARRTQKSSSCPSGIKSGSDENDPLKSDSDEMSETSEKLEDCDFISKECPKCHKKNVKTTVKQGKYYGECGCVG